ncbi:MAG: prephenate dehydrogenase/arogenate dehydrogenase family protein [Promethearchaeota archaeon]|nr:MAG: prephenate dehydrogenase/arogenate dehydrogenase family protein [Candidatus Lokiarchaeota archaeon]
MKMKRSKQLTIIGGSGGMGQVFSKYFKTHGFEVIIFARNRNKLRSVAKDLGVNIATSLEESVKGSDLVMISVPITSTINVIKETSPYLKKDALLFDISSLKAEVCDTYQQEIQKYPINCLSLHPMFGPGINDLKNYVMIAIKVGGTHNYEMLVRDLLDLFRSDGMIIEETTPNIHDTKIALTLGLPHMLNIFFLNVLRRSNESLDKLTRFTGTTFLLQKVFAQSIIQREMEMFGEIQMENPQFLEVLDDLRSLLDEYKKIVENKDKKKFYELFTSALHYSKNDPHFKGSYEYFYEFMEILKKKKE